MTHLTMSTVTNRALKLGCGITLSKLNKFHVEWTNGYRWSLRQVGWSDVKYYKTLLDLSQRLDEIEVDITSSEMIGDM